MNFLVEEYLSNVVKKYTLEIKVTIFESSWDNSGERRIFLYFFKDSDNQNDLIIANIFSREYYNNYSVNKINIIKTDWEFVDSVKFDGSLQSFKEMIPHISKETSLLYSEYNYEKLDTYVVLNSIDHKFNHPQHLFTVKI